ncbi:hypothetical protein, partial [Nocardia brasiliensis]|uniref:hypothetical protein n=1 Tax=Nocardia brasiliensis TaxID=37326 RepID=UPI0024541514
PTALSIHGAFLTARFHHHANPHHLDRAIEALQQAVSAVPDDYADRPAYLANCANAFLSRFETGGNADDLDSAVDMAADALTLIPRNASDRPALLANACIALRTRFDVFGELDDIEAAVAAGTVALTLAGDGTTPVHALTLVAAARRSRFATTGSHEDRHLARLAAQIAVERTAPNHPSYPNRATNLAACLLTDFENVGDMAALDESIRLGRSAVRAAPFSIVGAVATNLGNALLTRYELRGNGADLDDAITAAESAVRATPSINPFRPGRSSNLSNALRAKAVARNDNQALDQAIAYGREAALLANPRDPEQASYWSNLGLSLSDRFEINGACADIDEAISAITNADALTPPEHPSHLLYTANLAMALRQRFVAEGAADDIDRAIELLTEATSAVAPEHPHCGAVQLGLANALHSRYLATGEQRDYDTAIQSWRRATDSRSAASIRLTAAESWAVGAREERHWQVAAAGYQRAISLIPEVAWHGLDRSDKELTLTRLSTLTGTAAATALTAAQPDAALECLETGRSVLWAQMLNLHRQSAELHNQYPHLAERLNELSRLIR